MERTSNEWFNQWALQTHFSIGENETQQASFSHRYWLRSRRHFNQSAQRASAGCCRKSFQTPLRNPWALNVMNIATTKTHTPTHTHLPTATMPDSRLPDISLQMLFSMSRPHIFWYSWKTRRATGEGEHQWPAEQVWDGRNRGSQQTCTEVRLAASTQDGIELGLVRSHFVFASRVKFLSAKQTCRISNEDVSRLPSNCLWLRWHHKQRTWASCWTREMSTFSLSSRFPWTQSDTQNSHLVCSRLVLKLSAKWQPTKFVPERERWEVCGSDQRCRCWWRPPSSSRTLKGRCGFSIQCKF